MRIGVTCYPTVGGSGVVATELGLEMARRGHEVHFICYALPYRLGRVPPGVTFHEVTVPAYPLFQYPPYSLALASQMADAVRNHSIELLHVHYAIPHAISAYLAREILGGVPKLVVTLHGTDITVVGADPSFLPIVRLGIERADAVTAVSRSLAQETHERLGVTRPLVHEELRTDGVHLLVERLGKLLSVSQGGQATLEGVLEGHLARIERDERGLAQRLFPFVRDPSRLDDPMNIMIDPRFAFGRPALREIGITTRAILERWTAGESPEDLARDYDRTVAEIDEAVLAIQRSAPRGGGRAGTLRSCSRSPQRTTSVIS